MKTLLLIVTLFVFTLNASAGPNYSRDYEKGWEAGWEAGWVHVKGPGVFGVAPLPPHPPLSELSYEGGFGLGYLAAIKKAQETP